MRKVLIAVVMAMIAIPLAQALHAQSTIDLRAELATLQGEIADAMETVSSQSDSTLQGIARQRLESLELSKSIILNRIYAIEGGQALTLVVPAVRPDPQRAGEIQTSMIQTESRLQQALIDAESFEGVQKSLALSRAETEKLALAQLRLAYFQAKYGLFIPAATVQDGSPQQDDSALQTASSEPWWADPRYPDIDYSDPLFESAAASGARIAGWWTIDDRRAGVGAGRSVLAQNLSQHNAVGANGRLGAKLFLQCEGKRNSLTFFLADKFLVGGAGPSDAINVSYRIDNGNWLQASWDSVVAGQGAMASGFEAVKLIGQLYGKNRLAIQVSDASGSQHFADFELAGINPAIDAVATACEWGQVTLNRQDYKLLQTLLNIAGFNSGTPDGIWGRNSQAAMRSYQHSAGLPATGHPDVATLDLLGLGE